MADKKRQHFVPRFYLKAFSPDAGRKSIRVIVTNPLTLINSANLAQQCYKDYFYGKDLKTENALCKHIESPGSRIIRQIIDSRTLPDRNNEDFALLYSFVLFQEARTERSVEEMTEAFSDFIDHVFIELSENFPEIEELKDDLSDIKVSNIASFNLDAIAKMIPLVGDLECKILINETDRDFITSDAPVVRLNPYHYGNFSGGVTGWAMQGLQVLFPISPVITLVLFDSKVYGFGHRHQKVVSIKSRADVEWLNKLQLLSANKCIYFCKASEGQLLMDMFNKIRSLRPVKKASTRKFPKGQDPVNHYHRVDLKVCDKLSVSKILSPMRRIPKMSRQYRTRQPELVWFYMQFLEAVRNGLYSAAEFETFLGDICKD